MSIWSLMVWMHVSVYRATTVRCDLMSCCFLPAFQVKERSKRTERKVSTALFFPAWSLFSFFPLLLSKGETMGTWDLILFLFGPANKLSLSVFCSCRAFRTSAPSVFIFSPFSHSPYLLPRRIPSHAHTQTLHDDIISLNRQAPIWYHVTLRLACSSQVINTGNTSSVHSGEWVTLDEAVALSIPVLYTCPPSSISQIPLISSLLFTSHLTSVTSVTGCSDKDNSQCGYMMV